MELKHHGIKGQKWGVRHGPPYPLQKITKGNSKTGNEIYDTLTPREKRLLLGGTTKPVKQYMKDGEEKYLINSVLLKIGNVPVAQFDLWDSREGHATAAILVRNDPQYRKNGYGYEVSKKGLELCKKYSNIKTIGWGAYETNIGSRHIAEKLGFKEQTNEDGWVSYEKKNK